MRLNHGMIALMLSVTALASAAAMTGCATDGLVYDTDGRDYHLWDPGENRLYLGWEIQTHRGHLDFHRRSYGDRREYWGWRHE
jgi:hypothetical protein